MPYVTTFTLFLIYAELNLAMISDKKQQKNFALSFFCLNSYLCRACLHSFFIDRQSTRELRITSIPRDAAI